MRRNTNSKRQRKGRNIRAERLDRMAYRSQQQPIHQQHPDSEHPQTPFDVSGILPEWDLITVPDHAIDQYLFRTRDSVKSREEVAGRIKRAVMRGRRSDHDPKVLDEYKLWLKNAKWCNRGRKVTLFVCERTKLCCFVVPCLHVVGRIAVLTTFFARHGSLTYDWDGLHDEDFERLVEQIKKNSAEQQDSPSCGE
jgi:hypothetical protein